MDDADRYLAESIGWQDELVNARRDLEALRAEVVLLRSRLDGHQCGWQIIAREQRERAEAAEARVSVLTEALGELVDACDEYENSGYSGGFHEAKTAARALLSHPEQNPANCPTCGDYRQRDLSSAEFPCRDPWHRLPACPSCGSTDPKVRRAVRIDGARCFDAWHVSPKEG